jgi:phosphomannomutase
MDVKFGTSGLRGLAGDLASGAAFRHVHAFCRLLLDNGMARQGSAIFIARDRRDSSPLLAAQAMAAVRLAGFDPADCGEVPTPALAYHAFAREAACIMVTGSHIPADRNGLKFYRPGAEIDKADEAGITGRAPAAPDLPASIPPLGENAADTVMAAWRQRHSGLLAKDALTGLAIGVHEHSSVATGFLGKLLAGFGAKVVAFGKTSAFTPVDTEAVGPEFIQLYAATLRRHGLDAIVSADADGDRPLLADENGQPVPGDLIGWLAAQWTGADAVATPVTSNSAITDATGLSVLRTRVGSPFVIEAMERAARNGARHVAGFEANGGFLLGSDCVINGVKVAALPTRDSTLPLLAALRHMRQRGLKAGNLVADAGFRATASGRLQDFPAENSAVLMKALQDPRRASAFAAGQGEVAHADMTDGVRLFLANGEVMHLRPSGNAPEMRFYAEAATKIRAAELLSFGLDRIRSFVE